MYSVMFDRVVPDYIPSVEAHKLAGSTLGQLAHRLERAMTAGRLRSADRLRQRRWCGRRCHGVVSLELKESARSAIVWPDVYNGAMDMIVSGLA